MSTISPESELLLEVRGLLSTSGFSKHELLCIKALLLKMRGGSLKHGALNLETDRRSWRAEKLGELSDYLWYCVFDDVQRMLVEESAVQP